ncbi:xanthine dehydrogenase family protein molybdopterin-binding subunit [Bradyrhizobium sp. 187]|uniref:xanthine dehydrogenase family protein molybdopterin-binding subunit n=1 Tax=Bradyrhizobium sp. 187 TaxID=2782655 RepID=UPI001FFE3DEA|nr:xanthine dehydrogenase family protein molybdopterin-binding subunit [Bradyrhizobium sp. 187]UPJ71889.1 xanthine dehydrogenase family protein molybdopterin-binding subunit [Bradyrhizobium sp. 187]
MREFAVGQRVSRFEDARLVRGAGCYIDDIVLPRMVYGYVLRSPHAHAKIRSIDATRARRATGVLLVLTGAEWKSSGWGDLPVPGGQKRRDGSAMYRSPYPALVQERVRWVGDYVAFVAAESRSQAVDAAELIEVDYEVLPSVTSTAHATAAGAPRVWDECPDNICFVCQEGDKAAVNAAFARADHVVRHQLTINRVTAVTMEPRGCIADYNAAEEHYTVHAQPQTAHTFRSDLATLVLKVPESKVRIIAHDVGGSFGMKSPIFNEVALVLLASRILSRPVKWTSTRSEAFLSDAEGRDNVTEAELALDKNGVFLGMRVKTIANMGAHLQSGSPNFVNNLGSLAGVYRTPAIHADVTAVYTNTNPVRPYRGNGRPEAAYVIERMVEIAAAQTGIDPVELRRRNLIPPEAMPFKTGLTFTYDCGEFEKVLEEALRRADVAGFSKRRTQSESCGKLRGLGISYSIERAGTLGFEGAEIRFDRSGALTLFSGSLSQGQGHETVFKQLVCDRLGIHPDQVTYVQGDTDKVFFGQGTSGSRSAALAGSAFHGAMEKILDKGKQLAAHLLGVEAAEVNFGEGIFSTSKTNRTVTIQEVARAAANSNGLPPGMEGGFVATAVYNANVENFPNGCHVCEVEIDRDTGEVAIERYTVVDDVGTVLNPMLLHGQIHGGVVQGIGQILMEDIRRDDSGQPLTGSFMDYAMPRASDVCNIEVGSYPVPTKTNPIGVKGAGEAGCVGALPAVSNSLVSALFVFGVRHIEMPATSERVWRAIHRRDPVGST